MANHLAGYRLSVKATDDLRSILTYTAETFGEDQAERYVAQLKRHLVLLSQNPFLAPERHELQPPVRIFPSGGHSIVYQERADHIFVVRFLHQRMDLVECLG